MTDHIPDTGKMVSDELAMAVERVTPERTTANEVLALIKGDDPVIMAAKHFGLADGALIEFAYTLIGDRKDRRFHPGDTPEGEA